VFGGRPQVDVLAERDPPTVVLLSIGGNDAGFAEIGIKCVSPGAPDCRRSASFWLHRLDSVAYPAMVRAHKAVREAARGAEVFVLTYPNPIGPTFCPDIGLRQAELGFIRNVFIDRLNELIRRAASVARVRVIDVTKSLDGHRLCEQPLSRAAVNFIQLGRTRGTTLELGLRSLGSLANGTFHPNPLGHSLLAKTVREEIESFRDGELPPLPPPPTGPLPKFVPKELGPPVGAQPFPEGTRCTGEEVAFVSPVAAEADVRSVSLEGVRPGSTVCYRSFQAAWRSARANAEGGARVPVEVGRAGVGGVNEILAELPSGVWKKVVVSRLGAADEAEPPEEPSNVGLYVLLGVLGAGLIVALVLRWIALGRHGRRSSA
jgi:hypothetical protein